MILNGTYNLPQFSVSITNPELTVISHKRIYAEDITELDFILSVTGASFGMQVVSPGNLDDLGLIETFIEQELQQYEL